MIYSPILIIMKKISNDRSRFLHENEPRALRVRNCLTKLIFNGKIQVKADNQSYFYNNSN